MRFTISREKLQEGLAAVTASIPAKTTLPVLANILVEATDKGIRLVRHRSRHRRDHRSRGRRRDAGCDHDSREEAQRDRARASAGARAHCRRRRTARHARLRSVALQDPRPAARRVPGVSERSIQRELAHSLRRSAEADLAHVVRRVDRREPSDPQRRAVGAQAGHDADGRDERPSAREDGNADQIRRRAAERSDRAAEGARADSPALSRRTKSSRSRRAKITSDSARRSPRSTRG